MRTAVLASCMPHARAETQLIGSRPDANPPATYGCWLRDPLPCMRIAWDRSRTTITSEWPQQSIRITFPRNSPLVRSMMLRVWRARIQGLAVHAAQDTSYSNTRLDTSKHFIHYRHSLLGNSCEVVPAERDFQPCTGRLETIVAGLSQLEGACFSYNHGRIRRSSNRTTMITKVPYPCAG
jgi:hypothetical protein